MDPGAERHEIVERLRRDIARRFPGVVQPAAPPPGALQPGGPARYPTGYAALDALLPGGGLPAGRLVTIAGPASSGKLSVALAAVARATAVGACCAFIDTGGEFFPPSAAACGIDLARLLVVRAPLPAVARATCVIVQSRAFALVVLDLSRALPTGAAPGDAPDTEAVARVGTAPRQFEAVARVGTAPREFSAAQAMRLGVLCREAEATLLALGAPAALHPFTTAAALRLRVSRSLSGARVAVEGGAAPPATIELQLVRHASYCLRATPRLRLAGSSAGRGR
jgi:hypothetical protein